LLDRVNIFSTGGEANNTSLEEKISRFDQQKVLFRKLLDNRDHPGENHIHKIAIELLLSMVSGRAEFSDAAALFIFFKRMIADKFGIGEAMLQIILQKPEQQQIVLYDAIIKKSKKIKEEKNQILQEPTSDEEVEDNPRFYISNAGLVLVANYLPAFFNELQLLEEGRFISSHHQSKAVFLLHYLCTGQETNPEYTLPLNKILCGLSLEEPLTFHVPFSEKEKNECDILLAEIINNWQKLGDTSVDALRESFLRRDGILSVEDNGWKLMIERKGYDILLDSIPWSFQHIKLNWMDTIITTEW